MYTYYIEVLYRYFAYVVRPLEILAGQIQRHENKMKAYFGVSLQVCDPSDEAHPEGSCQGHLHQTAGGGERETG